MLEASTLAAIWLAVLTGTVSDEQKCGEGHLLTGRVWVIMGPIVSTPSPLGCSFTTPTRCGESHCSPRWGCGGSLWTCSLPVALPSASGIKVQQKRRWDHSGPALGSTPTGNRDP